VTTEDAAQVIEQAAGYGGHKLPYSHEDVAEVKHGAIHNEECGEPDWIFLFKMKDGRYATFHGGHDYTGWD